MTVHKSYSPPQLSPSFRPTLDTNAKNQCLLIIMIKINSECVSECFLHCLKQTEAAESVLMVTRRAVLVHSDGLSK